MYEKTNGKNLPEKKIRAGAISATIWQNSGTNDKKEPYVYRTISLDRNYRDKNGNWQNTNSMRVNDLPKASLVLTKAYEYSVLRAQETEEVVM